MEPGDCSQLTGLFRPASSRGARWRLEVWLCFRSHRVALHELGFRVCEHGARDSKPRVRPLQPLSHVMRSARGGARKQGGCRDDQRYIQPPQHRNQRPLGKSKNPVLPPCSTACFRTSEATQPSRKGASVTPRAENIHSLSSSRRVSSSFTFRGIPTITKLVRRAKTQTETKNHPLYRPEKRGASTAY